MFFCFFKDTATTHIYTYLHTLSLHDALPIWIAIGIVKSLYIATKPGRDAKASDKPVQVHLYARLVAIGKAVDDARAVGLHLRDGAERAIQFGIHLEDRKSTRLNSSH